MSRVHFALFLTFIFACTDENAPPAASSSNNPNEVTPENGASGVELELNFTGVDREAHTALSGGATTVFKEDAEAFETAAPNLSGDGIERHEVGDEAFGLPHVRGSGNSGGLGPVFDNTSCEACHVGDGRGSPPAIEGGQFTSMLFRSSISGQDANGGPLGIPAGFGGQLQMQAVSPSLPDIQAVIHYVGAQGSFTDGTHFVLQVPHYIITGVYPGLPTDFLFSPRVAPVVFGLGLLEAVPDQLILSKSDPRDADRDGISGRVNLVYDAVHQQRAVGRFGWKANTPNLMQQTAGAFNGDMGITSDLFPTESCAGRSKEPGCNNRHSAEVNAQTVADVAFYTQTLAVPARRHLDDPSTNRGENIFYAVGCNGCHTPTLRTGVLPGLPEVSNQVIHPYTDLLVHDMGPGLADGRPDFQASGSEWRTPPLWGIGLVQTVNGHTRFMHDGRARSLLEAVLWHGGEAGATRDRVKRLTSQDRDALIAFLQSL
jgi:CxxC motif-containing protein (DUF1111 family)